MCQGSQGNVRELSAVSGKNGRQRYFEYSARCSQNSLLAYCILQGVERLWKYGNYITLKLTGKNSQNIPESCNHLGISLKISKCLVFLPE